MPKFIKGILSIACLIGLLLSSVLAIKTSKDLLPVPESLQSVIADVRKLQVLDRHGAPLTITYQNRWNTHDYVWLHEIPEFLQRAFIVSEDKRFFKHRGVDWNARLHAVWQNIRSLKVVRGASTVSEQVIRMIHPRPRTLWSRWLEGLEAARLETKATKADIFEFYLNQVPYAANRRGVFQAALYYFNRDLDTLSRKEMMALAVLVRAPTHLDLYSNPDTIIPSIERLAAKLHQSGLLSAEEYLQILNESFHLARPELPVNAGRFVNYILKNTPQELIQGKHRLNTNLDGYIQQATQDILDQCLKDLKSKLVFNGAALVVDHTNNEILAWVIAGHGDDNVPGGLIDAVTTPRQPGSALKPFLYALAMEHGWTAATLIDDSPLAESVGVGLHTYHNYNRSFYGPVSLRQALGNSLNIPAVRAIHFVGVNKYLSRLRDLGFESLVRHPDFYGDGLALGNGEVTLFELVQAYTVFARRGMFLPLRTLQEMSFSYMPKMIFSEEVTSLIANILSDPDARNFEFGHNSLLNLPLQTAVKTGTSSDYRDAWAVGFNYHYTAGVWIGNLDGTQTDGVTGAAGPALALRSIFSELNRFKDTRPLFLSPKLLRLDICDATGQISDGICFNRTEWFVAGTEPQRSNRKIPPEPVRLRRPTNGLQLAMDPRIPDDQEAFEFYISGICKNEAVDWEVDNSKIERTYGGRYLWPLERGDHNVKAIVWKNKNKLLETEEISFTVK
ncbi:MAG: penicillin-binding protein 1C [Desulfobacterales bacterium PC51MH44]|nr:MAG: penicillin-binding protein 1C [Desulfobacterales bacterium PC51MH44]